MGNDSTVILLVIKKKPVFLQAFFYGVIFD